MLCRRGTRGSLCQASLWTAYYQGIQCNRLCRTHAEPVCRINWIRRHAIFHHAGYTASYAARSATWQAMPLATPGAAPTRQRLDMLNGGFQEQARKSRSMISFTCNAIIYDSMLLLLHRLGPPVGDPTAMYAPPLRYKREALAVHNKKSRAHTDARWTQHKLSQTLSRQGNTTHGGRRVLRSGGPNHSNPAVFIVFLNEIELVTSYPRVLTLWA